MQIDKNIPIPVGYSTSGETKTTLLLMEIGDSFHIPKSSYPPSGVAGVRNKWNGSAGRVGYRLTSRVDSEGIRFWRKS